MRRQTKADESLRKRRLQPKSASGMALMLVKELRAAAGTKLKIPSADLIRLCGLWWEKIY